MCNQSPLTPHVDYKFPSDLISDLTKWQMLVSMVTPYGVISVYK